MGGLLLFAGPAVLLFLINAYRPADPVSLVAGPGDLGNLRTFFYFQLAILLGVLLLAVRAIVRRARAGKVAASGRKNPGKARQQGGRKRRNH